MPLLLIRYTCSCYINLTLKLLFYTNRCIDKQEAKERECKVQQEMIEAAKHVVLNCPMCGKVCNTQAVSVKNLVLGFYNFICNTGILIFNTKCSRYDDLLGLNVCTASSTIALIC